MDLKPRGTPALPDRKGKASSPRVLIPMSRTMPLGRVMEPSGLAMRNWQRRVSCSHLSLVQNSQPRQQGHGRQPVRRHIDVEGRAAYAECARGRGDLVAELSDLPLIQRSVPFVAPTASFSTLAPPR